MPISKVSRAQQLQIVIKTDDDAIGMDRAAVAEIRTWNDGWVADARVNQGFCGSHDSLKGAASALAKALRQLADTVESQ